jgi:hypothetical protein
MSDRKTLLPELLPQPSPLGSQSPRERVAARARSMLDRLSGLKTTAGAALLAAHCGGYGVVDPLPPPPVQCTTIADPFTHVTVSGIAVAGDGGPSSAVIFVDSPSTVGYQVTAVRVTAGGTLVLVQDASQGGAGGGTHVQITIRPDGSGGPIEFEIDLGCGDAATTKHYRASYNGYGYPVVDLG